MLRVLLACLLMLPAVSALPGRLGAGTVVVELYTSQGCPFCPPADGFFTTLAERDDILPLALHVDYWDYIGWADTFADPHFTERQKDYARKRDKSSVYTPQIVVQGTDALVGSRTHEVMESIISHMRQPDRLNVSLAREAGTLRVSLAPTEQDTGLCEVYLVRYEPSATVAIERGENAGREITYVNIVTEWRRIGSWDGAGETVIEADLGDGDQSIAVVVQSAGMGPVMGAARLD